MSENTTPEKTTDGGLSSPDLLALLDSEIDQAKDRQESLIREIEINQTRLQVIGEYRVRFMDLRDKLRARISSLNSQ